MSYKSSMYKSKHQRMTNKAFKKVNKVIENDDLWRGRFQVRQNATFFRKWEDNSGYYLVVEYYFYDKKTQKKSDIYWESANHLSNSTLLYCQMNDFIVNHCKVWTLENPYEDYVDYRFL